MLESRAIAKAREGEGCPRCGGCVYMAEQMLAKGRVSVTRFSLAPLYNIMYVPVYTNRNNFNQIYVGCVT